MERGDKQKVNTEAKNPRTSGKKSLARVPKLTSTSKPNDQVRKSPPRAANIKGCS